MGFIFGYLVLRELPLRNFYARSIIMLAYGLRFMSQYAIPLPLLKNFSNGIVTGNDEYRERRLANYPIAHKAATSFIPAQDYNPYAAYLNWAMGNPGHIDLKKQANLNNASYFLASERQVAWDGTFNMPTRGLADKESKNAAGLRFINH